MSDPNRNRLGEESSPYLLQHADNPVHWYPWGDAALAAARETGRPILLSIGYSACHWCHVMAHESFENDDTAALMNRLFVNVKVDREERPDLDRIYQVAHQLITQRGGGWPLTMFLEPEKQQPFFGGTYFPPEAKYGMPSFRDLLLRVAGYFDENRDAVRDQAARIAGVFGQLDPPAIDAGAELGSGPIAKLREALGKSADREFGGFGSAPKFPHPHNLERLLRHWRDTAQHAEPDVEALFLVSLSASRMAEGGIYDQLGGGFCRYAVDREWQIPHFEKMLYDNGPLLALYADLHVATGEPLFARIASQTADYLLADLQAEDGGFYSSRDADSEGEEGRYYLWTPDEVSSLLDDDDFDLVCRHFGLDRDPNFEGRWHLVVRQPVTRLAERLGESADELQAVIDRSRQTLLEKRALRVLPARDEKRLASWNALAIRGLAIAGRRLDRADCVEAASRAIEFTQAQMFRDGRLCATYADGRARFAAYLDDHAFLLDAALELLQARWSEQVLQLAITMSDLLLRHFEDADTGGFFFTADDAETLIARPKPLADDAMPSGNGVAAAALQRIGFLLGESRYLDAAERCLRFAWQAMDEYPHGHVSLVNALEEHLQPPDIVILRGDPGAIEAWQRSLAKLYAPRRLVFGIPRGAGDLPGSLGARAPTAEDCVAYRCRGHTCSPPVSRIDALLALLDDE